MLKEYEMYFKVQINHNKTEHVQRESGVKEKYLYSVNRQFFFVVVVFLQSVRTLTHSNTQTLTYRHSELQLGLKEFIMLHTVNDL